MLLYAIYALLLATSSSRIQRDSCEVDCGNEAISNPSSCSNNVMPWLCMIGHSCCKQKSINKHTTKSCVAESKNCQAQGGACVSAKANKCLTAAVAWLCKPESCTCCLEDNPKCKQKPPCRFRGGYCFKAKSKQHIRTFCPSRNTNRRGCGGRRCRCCIPDRKCRCGKAVHATRIVGGYKVKPKHKYPWAAGIQVPDLLNGSYVCGATVINDRYVITAAHCLHKSDGSQRKPNELLVGVGDHLQFSSTDDTEGVTIIIEVKTVIVHRDYSPEDVNNDIALLQLKKSLDLTSFKILKPVCLPTNPHKTYKGITGNIYGWGTKNTGSGLENVLQETKVPILKPDCEGKVIGLVSITPQMLCAGHKEGGKDTCLGDSGGALTIKEKGRHVLVGITSFGEGCGVKDSPGVYARVTAFLDWILENTSDSDTSYCN